MINLGKNLSMISPFPVAAAAPASLSAYPPAPATGESPTLLQLNTYKFNIQYGRLTWED